MGYRWNDNCDSHQQLTGPGIVMQLWVAVILKHQLQNMHRVFNCSFGKSSSGSIAFNGLHGVLHMCPNVALAWLISSLGANTTII